MVLESNQYFIHVWVKGEEHLDSDFTALEEAVKRFEYLKDHWQEVFPDELTAIELVDQYFDQIDQFNPINKA